MVASRHLFPYHLLGIPLANTNEPQTCNRAIQRIKRERSEERIEVLLGTVKSLMENMQLSAQQVMAAMNISEEDKQKLIKKL